jgi:hypothetical protein
MSNRVLVCCWYLLPRSPCRQHMLQYHRRHCDDSWPQYDQCPVSCCAGALRTACYWTTGVSRFDGPWWYFNWSKKSMRAFFLVFSSFGDENTTLCRNVGHQSPSDEKTTVVSKRLAPVAEWRVDHHFVATSNTSRPMTRGPPLCRNVEHKSPNDAWTTTFSKRRTPVKLRDATSQQIGCLIAPLRKPKKLVFLKLHFPIAYCSVVVGFYIIFCYNLRFWRKQKKICVSFDRLR